ncbi:FadR/GntR family transcriptional regulator [Kribbella turkmenica]|uniref:FadR/GntR family transcriptional regulator n=1 Tax=Kribbella turkmenica TaxID=2530375 RepID=UPI001F34D6DC|nr:FCD domain-containing protein [Kribbella turkmenica]
MEALAAGRAARTVGRATLTTLEQAIAQMQMLSRWREPTREQRFHDADVAFHEGMAMASGSKLLAFVLGGFEQSLRRSFAASYKGYFARGDSFDEVVDAHRAVLQAVRDRDVGGAEKAMRSHLSPGSAV